ncbi:MAG TPA: hypothetical protein VM513_31100 [Kofleriaceae bacterium]|jgi:hypothetical protein|nr:hypothetical protein [Kofleriaceae bacterium]
MRSVHAIAALALAASVAPASACPRGARCLVATQQEITASARPRAELPRARRVSLRLTSDVTPRDPVLAMTPAPAPDARGERADPSAIHVLFAQVVAYIPRYEDRQLTVRPYPLAITTPTNTIAGLGVTGKF